MANLSETIKVGSLTVRRMGYGAMRLPGPEVWGEPADPDKARAVLRRAVELLGVNFIDTAWFYGPHVANRLIVEALHPYPKDLVIATKLGGKRTKDKGWAHDLSPAALRKACEGDLKSLRLDRIDVLHLRHIPHTDVPLLESLGALIELVKEGKVLHLALSNVTVAQIEEARALTPIVAVQNAYSLTHRGAKRMQGPGAYGLAPETDEVVDYCAKNGIAFLPFFPLAVGALDATHPVLSEVAGRHRASPAQIALAWLLHRSPAMLPIPGTGSLEHLEENWAAQKIALSAEDYRKISEA